MKTTSRLLKVFPSPGPLTLFLFLLTSLTPVTALEFWVATKGQSGGNGSKDQPWDLASALSGVHSVAPGATIWIRGGTYRWPDRAPNSAFGLIRLRGTAAQPIHVRAVPGERVTIDGGLIVGTQRPEDAPAHVWIRDLEITVSETNRRTEQKGSWPSDLGGPNGGVTMHASESCKLINLFVHNNIGGGINLWSPAINTEVYGCIIANNGWSAPDRGHGHGFYAQNREGWKTIRHCLVSVPTDRGDQLAQFYGSGKAHLENFRVEENIAYGTGRHTRFLLGGGAVSRNNHVLNNAIYLASLQLGYSPRENTGGRATGNILFRGGLNLHYYQDCEVRKNHIVGDGINRIECSPTISIDDNLIQRTEKEFPVEPRILMFRNEHDPNRAHLAVFNWRKANSVTIPSEVLNGVLKPGDRFRLLDPVAFHGKPVLTGTSDGKSLNLPAIGEFAAFVLFREGY